MRQYSLRALERQGFESPLVRMSFYYTR